MNESGSNSGCGPIIFLPVLLTPYSTYSTPLPEPRPTHACRHCWKRVYATEVHYCGDPQYCRGSDDFVSLNSLRGLVALLEELRA